MKVDICVPDDTKMATPAGSTRPTSEPQKTIIAAEVDIVGVASLNALPAGT
jgi:hypothetical protein